MFSVPLRCSTNIKVNILGLLTGELENPGEFSLLKDILLYYLKTAQHIGGQWPCMATDTQRECSFWLNFEYNL
uniref:Uncharacterized protein n=1 Tax=Anguilla anguilla TaxID=7936 RepID=A0A0E9RFV0_ANGAN